MNAFEIRSSTGLSALYALRMFGLFSILPVISIYASQLEGGSDPMLLGMALGAYGLAQAILQLPFGMLSDRFGRKRLIYLGLILFGVGGVIAGAAESIHTLMIGRTIQGAGAISAVITALLADLTREEYRTRAMAMVGMTIGITFSVSLVIAPILTRWIGIDGLFYFMTVLAVLAILGVKYWVPNPAIERFHADAASALSLFPSVLKNKELLRLNLGILSLHAAQMAIFVVLPFIFIERFEIAKESHWNIYLPVVLIGFILMIPAVIVAEKKAKLKPIFLSAILLMLVALVSMSFLLNDLIILYVILSIYFIAFNLLEATLPSLISKIAPARAKGTAMGIYNTSQSLGLFLGGLLGGWLYASFGETVTFLFCAALVLIWFVVALGMKAPPAVRSALFPLLDSHLLQRWDNDAELLQSALEALEGVEEVVVVREEGQVYMKVLQRGWDESRAHEYLGVQS